MKKKLPEYDDWADAKPSQDHIRRMTNLMFRIGRKLRDRAKPVVVVTVSGGGAEYQVMPVGNESVEVLLVDLDNLNDSDATATERLEMRRKIQALPGDDKQSKAFKKYLLGEMRKLGSW